MRQSRAASVGAVALALLTPFLAGIGVSAHRLDEYLQAARIDIGEGRVEFELSLTPGAAVAANIVADIDRDRDGSLSPIEQEAYTSRVLSAIDLEADGRPLDVRQISSSFPDVEAMQRGEGVIRLRADAVLPAQSAGAHHLFFRNAHRGDVSVYLANAVVPASDRFGVTAQHRDADQRELTVDYVFDAQAARSRLALLLVGIAAVTLVTTRLFGRRQRS
ncbi:MAG: hypothetical protein ND807_14900 [Vicinamibacterales bacterium]|nr:hypothetical protein [Vicinamibacterales bacterium]